MQFPILRRVLLSSTDGLTFNPFKAKTPPSAEGVAYFRKKAFVFLNLPPSQRKIGVPSACITLGYIGLTAGEGLCAITPFIYIFSFNLSL